MGWRQLKSMCQVSYIWSNIGQDAFESCQSNCMVLADVDIRLRRRKPYHIQCHSGLQNAMQGCPRVAASQCRGMFDRLAQQSTRFPTGGIVQPTPMGFDVWRFRKMGASRPLFNAWTFLPVASLVGDVSRGQIEKWNKYHFSTGRRRSRIHGLGRWQCFMGTSQCRAMMQP